MERWLFNVGAVLGSLCLVLAALTLVIGLKPLIFTSGSMGPAIPTGSLALTVPIVAAEIAPGEVVSVIASDGTRVTHRVVSADPSTGIVLKGDANAVADLQPFTGATVDRVLFSIPGLGYVLSWLASPWIFLLGGLLCAYLIYAAFFRPRPDAVGKPRDGSGDGAASEAGKSGSRRRAWLGIGAMVAVIAVAVPLGAAAKVESTQAAWTANAVAGSNIAAAVMPTPGPLICKPPLSGNRSVTIAWSEPNNAPVPVDHYEITVTAGGKSSDPPGIVPAGTSPSQTLSLDEDNQGLLGSVINLLGGLLEFLLGGPKPVDVSVVAVYPGGWKSAPKTGLGLAVIAPVFLSSPTLKCK